MAARRFNVSALGIALIAAYPAPGASQTATVAAGQTVSNESFSITYLGQGVYGTAEGGRFSNGAWQAIYSGGLARNTTLINSAFQTVRNGGRSEGVSLADSAHLTVEKGGLASDVAAANKSSVQIDEGGTGARLRLSGDASLNNFGDLNQVALEGNARLDVQRSSVSGTLGTVTGLTASGASKIISYGTVKDSVLSDTAQLLIYDGTAEGTRLEGQARMVVHVTGRFVAGVGTVYTPASAKDIHLADTATLVVGGLANNVTLTDQALQRVVATYYVDSSNQVQIAHVGTTDTTSLSNDSRQEVVGGQANNTTLQDRAQQIVSGGWNADGVFIHGGTASQTSLHDDAQQRVGRSGAAIDTTLDGRATQIVGNGGTANGSLLRSNSQQVIQDGGQAIGTVLDDRAKQTVENGGMARDSLLRGDSQQVIQAGGQATGTVLDDRAKQTVEAGGLATSTTLRGTAQQEVFSGGTALHTSIQGAGARVLVHHGAEIEALDLQSGRVEFVDPAGSPSTTPRTLKVGQLNGSTAGSSGTFELRFAPATGMVDRIQVDSGTGSHQLLVHASGAEPATPGRHAVVNLASGDAQFALANQGGIVELGTYQYTLASPAARAGSGGEWALVGTSRLSASADAALAQTTVSSLWLAEGATLSQRFAELRDAQGADGFWVRGFALEQRIDNGISDRADQRYRGSQIGADTRLRGDAARWLIGGFVGLGQAERDYRVGNGRINARTVGAYASYLPQAQGYLDLSASWSHYDNRYDVGLSDGSRAAARYRQNALGLAMEAGHAFALADGWFVEPAARAAVFRASAASYATSNGMQVEVGDSHSAVVEVATRFGRSFAVAGAQVRAFGRVGYAQELANRTEIRINANALHSDLAGGGVKLAAGVATQWKVRHHLHAGFDWAAQARIDQPWGVSLGYRYAW